MSYPYKITQQYGRSVVKAIGMVTDVNDAKLLIEAKMAIDAGMGTKVIYQILDGMDLVQQFDSSEVSTSSGTQGRGASTGSGFSPTPFNTSPRPAGVPHNWNKGEDEKDKR